MGLDVIHFIMKYFSKLILYPLFRPFVLLFFGLTSTGALALLFRVNIGLDQTLALPKVRVVKIVTVEQHYARPCVAFLVLLPFTRSYFQDSYLEPYFNETFTYLHTGAPVYFVIREGYDYTDKEKQSAICSGAGCNKRSLGQQIEEYSTASNL